MLKNVKKSERRLNLKTNIRFRLIFGLILVFASKKLQRNRNNFGYFSKTTARNNVYCFGIVPYLFAIQISQ